MINLLPRLRLDKLKQEEISNAIMILGIIIVAALLSFILMLLLVLIFYSSQLKSDQAAFSEKEKEAQSLNIEPLEKQMALNDRLFSGIGDFYKNQPKITSVFLKVAQALPSGTVLSDFSYSDGKVSLSGASIDRNSLIAFKTNLEQDLNFKNVVFPPGNWLAARNINFSVTFDYEF